MSEACPLCDGACAGADLAPLLSPTLIWFWEQLGRTADRRGDPLLVTGTVLVRAPTDAQQRAAATGLVGTRVLKPGQGRSVDLSALTSKLKNRGTTLTPGAVAAHATGRRLAVRAAARAQRRDQEAALLELFTGGARELDLPSPETIWQELRGSRWLARVLADHDPPRLVSTALAILKALPQRGERIDRRRLASDVARDPHALDHGTRLSGLVLGILLAAGRIQAEMRPREAWATLSVDSDDVVGGLIVLGLVPNGWAVPQGNVVTLPPRILDQCQWPRPPARDSWVFVTENPSVVSAAAGLAAGDARVRVICTMGTPSFGEIAAIGRVADAGWRVAVRADFDAKGIFHVASILSRVPSAVPWRMGRADYLETVQMEGAILETIPDTPWEPSLAEAMREKGAPAFEEAALPQLLGDLRRGAP